MSKLVLQVEFLTSLEVVETTNSNIRTLYRVFLLVYNLSMEIFTVTIKGYDIDMTFNEGYLAYTFQRLNKKTKQNESFGIKVKPLSTDPIDLVAASCSLIINAYETIEVLDSKKKKV